MSNFADEPVLRMPPLSTSAISGLAEAVLSQIAPECLDLPKSLPVLALFEDVLPSFGIHTYPVDDDSLPEEEALTDPLGSDGERIIRVRESVYGDLVRGGRIAYRPRATLPHELGHALIHVPIIRRRMRHPTLVRTLQRAARRDIKIYEQSEWQAWAFAGCLLMPARTLRQFARLSVSDVSEIYQVSEVMARGHLRRMQKADLLRGVHMNAL